MAVATHQQPLLYQVAGGPHVLDRGDAAEIDWDDDPTLGSPQPAPPSR